MINTIKNNKAFIKFTLIIFVLIFPHIEPGYLNVSGNFFDEYLYDLGRLLSSAFVLVCYIIYSLKNKYINKVVLSFCVLYGYVLINTVVQYGIYMPKFVPILSAITYLLLIDLFSKKHSSELVQAFLLFFEILIYTNIVLTILIYGNKGDLDYYFLGNRNGVFLILPISLMLSLLANKNKYSIRTLILFVACIITCFIRNTPVTGLIILVFFVLFYTTNIYKNKYFSLPLCCIIFGILFLCLVIFRIHHLMDSTLALLGKSTSLSGRDSIWDNVIELIKVHPLFGYGAGDSFELFSFAHAHNFVLDLLVQGGIIQLCLVGFFVFFVIKSIKTVKDNNNTKIIVLTIAAVLLYLLVDIPDPYLYWLPFMFASCSESICKQLNDSTN